MTFLPTGSTDLTEDDDIDQVDQQYMTPLLGKIVHDLGGKYFIPAAQLGTNALYSLEVSEDDTGITIVSTIVEPGDNATYVAPSQTRN